MSDYRHALATAIAAAREAGAILRDDLRCSDGPRGGGTNTAVATTDQPPNLAFTAILFP